jgi:hypothetical protein
LFHGIARLPFHERELAGFAEDRGRKLAAGIAIDTRGIDEYRPLHVFGQSARSVRHTLRITRLDVIETAPEIFRTPQVPGTRDG